MISLAYLSLFFMMITLVFLIYGAVVSLVFARKLRLTIFELERIKPDLSLTIHIYLICIFSLFLAMISVYSAVY